MKWMMLSNDIFLFLLIIKTNSKHFSALPSTGNRNNSNTATVTANANNKPRANKQNFDFFFLLLHAHQTTKNTTAHIISIIIKVLLKTTSHL